MNLLNDKKVDSSRFTSYIDDGSFEIDLMTVQEHHQKLLDGEQLIHQSQNVIMFEQMKVTQGLSGLLTITTFKLSFIPSGGIDDDATEYYQKSTLLGPYEVCLSAIDTIYHVTGTNSTTRKKFSPGHNVSAKIKELQIVCKNMRVLWFSFKNSDKDSGRQVTNTLLHHVYPKRHSLLFAYDFPAPPQKTATNQFRSNGSTPKPPQHQHKTRLFRTLEDWQHELQRTASTSNWRISLVNESFDPCPHLPRHLVVPKFVTDSHLLQSLRSFRNECFPVWTWGTPGGAALVRMADLLATITDRTQENTLLEKVRESHPHRRAPEILYLDRDCPSPSQVRLSYVKLRDLCTPTTCAQLRTQDARFHSLLDASRWLHNISQCLKVAVSGARTLMGADGATGPRTVVLQEGNGQDMNCVIASLIQIILDPYARTMVGFQSLLQKEWIAMGHPFAQRLRHIVYPIAPPPTHLAPTAAAAATAPLLLLFLDCVYQLTRHFPVAFQYTSTYLCTVWDGAHLTAYETFLFDSERARVLAEGARRVTFRSLWQWHEQFPRRRDVRLFCNPLYDDDTTAATARALLDMHTGLPHIEIWAQCYFRWLPGLEVKCGGSAHADVAMRFVSNEINTLRRQLQSATKTCEQYLANGASDARTEENAMLEYLCNVNSFYPFSVKSRHSDEDKRRDIMLLDNGIVDEQSQAGS